MRFAATPPVVHNNNSPAALGAVAIFTLGSAVLYFVVNGRPPPAVTFQGGGVGVTVPVTTTVGPTVAEMRAAAARYDADRDAMKRQRPGTEAEVERVLRRRADQCITAGGDRYCHWFYATMPPEEGQTVLSVAFDESGHVKIADF